MRDKQNIKLPLLVISVLFATILVLSFASATTTLEQPKANTNHTGTISLISCQTDFVNADNATIHYNLTSSGTAILTLVANISNTTTSGGSFNASSTSVAALSDSMTYTFWCTVTNATGQTENGTLNTGITIDNTAPVCSVSAGSANIPSNGYNVITWSVTDGLSLVSNYENVSGPTGYTTTTYNTAVTSQTVYADSLVGTTWRSSVNGTDRAGNTCTATTTWKSYNNNGGSGTVNLGAVSTTPTGVKQTALGGSQTTTENKFVWVWIIGGIVLIVVIVGVLSTVISKKSRHKRRRR